MSGREIGHLQHVEREAGIVMGGGPGSRHTAGFMVLGQNGRAVVDSRTKAVKKIWSVERDVIGPPRLSRDAKWIDFSRRVSEGDIWLLSLVDSR